MTANRLAHCTAGVLCVATMSVHAQKGGNGVTLEQIIVTSGRCEASLQKTVIAITAIDGVALAGAGVA